MNPVDLIGNAITQFNTIIDNAISDNENDSFLSPLTELTKTVGKMTSKLLENAAKSEKKNLEIVKNYISNYLYENQNNEHVYTKYLWLQELFKWIENDKTSQLKFKYFSELLKD